MVRMQVLDSMVAGSNLAATLSFKNMRPKILFQHAQLGLCYG